MGWRPAPAIGTAPLYPDLHLHQPTRITNCIPNNQDSAFWTAQTVLTWSPQCMRTDQSRTRSGESSISQLHLYVRGAHFQCSLKTVFPQLQWQHQSWSCLAKLSEWSSTVTPGLPQSHAVQQLSCFRIELFALNSLSPPSPNWDSCWHWIGSSDLQLTLSGAK